MLKLFFFALIASAYGGALRGGQYFKLVPIEIGSQSNGAQQQAQAPWQPSKPQQPLPNYGQSQIIEGPPTPYEFAYDAEVDGGMTSRKESGDGSGRVTGSYAIREADGRIRTVNYVADQGGFRADIQTNEPGFEPDKEPADVKLNIQAPPPGLLQPPAQKQFQPRPPPAMHYPAAPQKSFGGGAAHGGGSKKYVLVPIDLLQGLTGGNGGGGWN